MSVSKPGDLQRIGVAKEDPGHVPTRSSRARRSTRELIVGVGLAVLLIVLAVVVLHGTAEIVAWLLVVLVLYGLVAPAVFPQAQWRGPYNDHDFGGPFG
jgi:hypothetical protein